MFDSFDPDQARRSGGLDLDPKCLQRLTADGTNVVLHLKWNTNFRFFTYKLIHTESLHAHRNSKNPN